MDLNRWIRSNPYSFALFLALIVAIIVGLSVGLTRQMEECPPCPLPDECPYCPTCPPQPEISLNMSRYRGPIPSCQEYTQILSNFQNNIIGPQEYGFPKLIGCKAPVKFVFNRPDNISEIGFGFGTANTALAMFLNKEKYQIWARPSKGSILVINLMVDNASLKGEETTFYIFDEPQGMGVIYVNAQGERYYLPLPFVNSVFKAETTPIGRIGFTNNKGQGMLKSFEVCSTCI